MTLNPVLPEWRSRLDLDCRTRRDDRHAVQNRLRNQAAIEGVLVKLWEASVVARAILVGGKRRKSQPLPSANDLDVGR